MSISFIFRSGMQSHKSKCSHSINEAIFSVRMKFFRSFEKCCLTEYILIIGGETARLHHKPCQGFDGTTLPINKEPLFNLCIPEMDPHPREFFSVHDSTVTFSPPQNLCVNAHALQRQIIRKTCEWYVIEYEQFLLQQHLQMNSTSDQEYSSHPPLPENYFNADQVYVKIEPTPPQQMVSIISTLYIRTV